MMVRKVWADFGPEFDPECPENPNDNCFTLAVDADDYAALEERLTSISRDYEELRKEIDGGSESMTHVDAIDAVREYKEQIHMLESHAKSWRREAEMNEIELGLLHEALAAIEDRLSGMAGDPLRPLADRIVAHLSRKKA